jgi:hypothetical protein
MTSKQMAESLYNNYLGCLIKNSNYYTDNGFIEEQAKQCALISVDEILKHCYKVMKPFWEEVKSEIEKL